MTIYISINQYKNLSHSGVLIAQGIKDGLQISEEIPSGTSKASNIYRVICASDNELVFRLCKSVDDYLRGQYIGSAEFKPGHLVDYCQKKGIAFDGDNGQIIQLQLESEDSKYVGEFVLDVRYDYRCYYVGCQENRLILQQKAVNFSPSSVSLVRNQKPLQTLVVHAQVPKPKEKKLSLYKGKCPTKNLFSLLDPAAQGQEIRFIESKYRDEQ